MLYVDSLLYLLKDVCFICHRTNILSCKFHMATHKSGYHTYIEMDINHVKHRIRVSTPSRKEEKSPQTSLATRRSRSHKSQHRKQLQLTGSNVSTHAVLGPVQISLGAIPIHLTYRAAAQLGTPFIANQLNNLGSRWRSKWACN